MRSANAAFDACDASLRAFAVALLACFKFNEDVNQRVRDAVPGAFAVFAPRARPRVVVVARRPHFAPRGVARRDPISRARAVMVELTIVDAWDGKNVTWRPIYEDDSEEYRVFTHQCEYAKSGRGKCGRCGEKIAKDTVRVGEPLKYRGGDYGWISKWMHPECYRAEGATREELERSVYGLDAFNGVDVVLTTYPVIEAEWRKIINRHLVACQWCGKKYLPRSMVTHLKYFCGPDAVRTEKLARREVTRDVANEKAMRTLKIKEGSAKDVKKMIPTPANFYKELMAKAGRETMSMYEGAHKARERAAAGLAPGGDAVAVKEEIVEPSEVMKALISQLPSPPSMEEIKEEFVTDEGDVDESGLAGASMASIGDFVNKAKKRKSTAKKTKVASQSKKSAKKSLRDASDDDESDYKPDTDEDDIDDDDGGLIIVESDSDEPKKKKKKKDARAKSADQSSPKIGATVSTVSTVEDLPTLSQGSGQLEGDSGDDVDLSDSIMHRTMWHRIVLDEAHKIKARTSNTAKCIYALKSTYKWCLTGTPLQNRIGDLYSLVRFLRMDPYAYYFCSTKGCECKTLSWNFGPEARFCTECGCGAPRHYSHFNRTVLNPINRYGYIGDGKKAMLTLRNDILLPMQLRRTKAERASDVQLPELKIVIQENEFNEVEQDFYESLYMLTRAKFDGFVKKGSVLHNYAHIFELLARLRQACDHPYLVIHSKSANVKRDAPDAPKVESPADAGDTVKHYCGMCQDEIEEEDAALASCKHIFHRECIMQYASCAPADGKKVTCPVCRTALTIDFSPESLESAKSAIGRFNKDPLPDKSILNKLDLTQYTSSTKVETLVNALRDMRNQENGQLNKAIVFSQYTAMIEIVEWRLKKAKFTIAKLLGSMPVTQRAANLQAFREDPNVSVILMSLKSGGEGLNLQAANYVYVLEPWWNPAVEMQAVMRAHRIGQHRPVTAVRFSTKGTIEERMMELQEKKQLVFEGCMDGNAAALSQLTAEDLQFLFKR
ncbi:P-loop containing nucleoside triphosphate hydrolase protein [Ostreococcus tauri]|uniref:P-loop containing nucleoside triphosphate hydrolase protein n=1 Tax=Ostreococcus tauri TaxID=70448 RepID=A0A1Y5IE96_OSTTA|nr:P-loop containing nucleoside triphosphate hydrolase protein [Ostreococcus tauri]